MKVSKRAEYGLTAMVHLARAKNKNAVSIRQIANTEGVPFEFLSKIFPDLEKAGLVKGKLGMNGGYFLAKPASKISVFDVVGRLENMTATECGICSMSKKCSTKNIWKMVDESIGKTLKSIKLSSLAS